MMDDETRRDGTTDGPGPDKRTDADCRRETFGSQEGAPSPLDRLVVAFVVTKEYDGSVMLSTPLTNDSVLRIVTTKLTDDDLAMMRRLPIQDLVNPGVALVVRSSVERLVKVARGSADVFRAYERCHRDKAEVPHPGEAGKLERASRQTKAENNRNNAEELETALEPFKDVAP